MLARDLIQFNQLLIVDAVTSISLNNWKSVISLEVGKGVGEHPNSLFHIIERMPFLVENLKNKLVLIMFN